MNRLALTSMLAGAALLLGAPLAWHLAQPEESVGDLDAVTATSTVDRESEDAQTDSEPDGLGTAPEPEAEPEPVEEAEPEPLASPTSLSIPTLGVDAPVVDVGLDDDAAMVIPDDVGTVGWYEPGVVPGAASGTAVLSGHVDSREQGRGALWDLRRMEVDDEVTIAHEDGSTSTWRVVARANYLKEDFPIADIFTRFGDPRMVLITCGGEFDTSTRSYAENVVVYTVPVDA